MSRGKSQTIEHSGVVEHITGRVVRVRIIQASACSSCAAAQLCRSSESKEKFIDAYATRLPRVGDRVVVEGTVGQGLRAVVWAYVVPLILLVAILSLAIRLTGNEGLSALCALLSLVPYYGVLYLLRDRLQKRLSFWIKSIN